MGMSTSYWQCTSGCNGTVNLANVNYICTGSSTTEDWEQGENTFTYTFPGIGPFTVEFTGSAWVSLDFGSSGSWSVGTVVYLASRSDTHQLNRSPVTTGKPMYTVQYGCLTTIRIPVVDDDGDAVRCRWSTGSECVSICNALPSANLDSNTCTISFPANHKTNGKYAVAVSVEDFPKSTIHIGSHVYTPNNKLSTVNLQFLVTTPPISGNCNDKPRFISPTPAQGATTQAYVSRNFQLSFHVTDTGSITKVDITSPAGMTYTSPQSVPSKPGSVFVTTTWIPQQNQVGIHIVCALAEDSLGKTSESRCININVNDVSPCLSQPCQNNGTCVRSGMTQNYTCHCVPGFTGFQCQTDINECQSFPCQNGGSCLNLINRFKCQCLPGYTGVNCEIDIDECASNPCQNLATCAEFVNYFNCTCPPGFDGMFCEIDIDECASNPCQNQATCNDLVNYFNCSCQAGFTGVLCEIDIDECVSNPCQNQATCNDFVNYFNCSCRAGFTGLLCEIDINECNPDPCNFLFQCEDLINEYHCGLIEWKVVLIISSLLIIVLMIIFFVIFLLKRNKYSDVDHSWLKDFIDIQQADVQPKALFQREVPFKKF
uniref:Sushi, von Willebrand factor type A, EGF and pentraxin domain-containing protein 1-like n=1 Tax=Crassostrea virginica TaxID=6565 RepID=A0A8B8B1R0_CRAVI|nr:sushi, von Willebrand factor type A, EGF and pentraxin domain-containing protein 1-like [Crassostrea virginica]